MLTQHIPYLFFFSFPHHIQTDINQINHIVPFLPYWKIESFPLFSQDHLQISTNKKENVLTSRSQKKKKQMSHHLPNDYKTHLNGKKDTVVGVTYFTFLTFYLVHLDWLDLFFLFRWFSLCSNDILTVLILYGQ